LVADLEQAIVSLANDRNRCARMGRAGRAKVLAEYTWPMKIERFVEIYREAIKRGAGAQGRSRGSLFRVDDGPTCAGQNSPSNWVRARRNPASNHLRAVLLEQYHVMAGNNINADWMMTSHK